MIYSVILVIVLSLQHYALPIAKVLEGYPNAIIWTNTTAHVIVTIDQPQSSCLEIHQLVSAPLFGAIVRKPIRICANLTIESGPFYHDCQVFNYILLILTSTGSKSASHYQVYSLDMESHYVSLLTHGNGIPGYFDSNNSVVMNSTTDLVILHPHSHGSSTYRTALFKQTWKSTYGNVVDYNGTSLQITTKGWFVAESSASLGNNNKSKSNAVNRTDTAVSTWLSNYMELKIFGIVLGSLIVIVIIGVICIGLSNYTEEFKKKTDAKRYKSTEKSHSVESNDTMLQNSSPTLESNYSRPHGSSDVRLSLELVSGDLSNSVIFGRSTSSKLLRIE